MQLRYRAICGWLMRAEFSNPVHFHCSPLVSRIYLDSLSTVYTPTSDGSRETLRIRRSCPSAWCSGSVGSTRLDSARVDLPATGDEYRDCEKNLERILRYVLRYFLSSFFLPFFNLANNSLHHPPYKNSIIEMKDSLSRDESPRSDCRRKVTFLRL